MRARRTATLRVLVPAALLLGACGGDAEPPPPEPEMHPGTRLMVDRLARMPDPSNLDDRIRELDRTPRPTDLQAGLMFAARRAQLLSRAGRLEQAAEEVRVMQAVIDEWSMTVPPAFKRDVDDLDAIIALWGGLQEACLADAEHCLFPFSEPIVTDGRAARAFEIYSRLLESNPNDLQSLWLLNLSAMAMGRHPDAVPTEWRIPPQAFASEADIGRFPNRARELGLDVPGQAGGSVMEDFDGDGDLDLMASSASLGDEIKLFINEDGRFVDRSHAAGLRGLTGGLNMVSADYDEDGDIDVFVLRGAWSRGGQPNSLLRNEGGGRFVEAASEAGVYSIHPGQTAAWVDFDSDGDLDLYVGNESETRSNPPRIHPAELFRNEGDGNFTEIAAEVGLDVIGFMKAVVWGDYDNDGRPDVYVSRFQEPNQLFRNEGPTPEGGWRFRDVTAEAGVAEPRESLPAWFWDYDNDGHLDLFIPGYRMRVGDVAAEYLGHPEIGALPRLYRNRGDGTFEDVTREARLERIIHTMGSNYGDLDNDGWLDFYAGTGDPDLRALQPNRMFRNAAGRFQDVTASGGFGHLGKGHGVAFGDLDGDGDQDMYVVIGGAAQADVGRNVLWENPGHGNRWITLRLEGVQANRSAIGARIRVTVATPEGERDIHRLVGTGGSFGASSLQQEIGLGRAEAIREIEIRWPGSDRVETFEGPPLDAVYFVREGAGRLEPVAVPRLRLGGGAP